MKFGKKTVTKEIPNTKLPNQYMLTMNDNLDKVKNRFKSYSRNSKMFIYFIVFALVGTIVLQIVRAEDEYGSIMTGADQLVLRYDVSMAHPIIENDFGQGSPPSVLLYGNGLLLCTDYHASHADSQVSPLMFVKQRQLSPSEVTAMFEKVRSLNFDDLLVRTLPSTDPVPAGATPSFSLITSAGERRATMYYKEKSDIFTSIVDYIGSECAKATDDFSPDDVVLETIKTDEDADSTVAKIPDLPGSVSKNTNEVQSSRLTGSDAKKAKGMVTKGNKTFKTSDGKKIKVRVLPKIPEFKTSKPYVKNASGSGVAQAAPYRTVKFLYVVAADQAIPTDAQSKLDDLANTLPTYYLSQVGKPFTTSGVTLVKGSKTVAQYQTCPAGAGCATSFDGRLPQLTATWHNLYTEYNAIGVNTIILFNWSNDGICSGLGGPANEDVDNVTYDYGFATVSATNCGVNSRYRLGAHEAGHGFGLRHTCNWTMMDSCGYTSYSPGYGDPLDLGQAALLRDYSPYFNGPVAVAQQDPAPIASGNTYIAITPARVLDSRVGASTVDGQYVGMGRRLAGSVTEVQVAGRAGVPADALSASLNVTAVNASGDGFMTVYPCGISTPNSSNVNYTTGSNVANFVISKLGAGKVCVYTSSETEILVDVSGAFPASSGSSYTNIVPARLMDTRVGGSTIDAQYAGTGQLVAGSITQLQVAGRAGVPATASAVSLNVTIINPLSGGYATVYPCDGTLPNTSSVNYTAGKVVSNAVISKLGTGKVCIFTNVATGLIVDVNGAFNSVTAYSGILPARILDSRVGASTIDGQYVGIGTRPAGSITEVKVAGRAGVKADALVVALNITAVNPASNGFITVYPCGIGLPNTSNINFTTGSNVANFVISKLGTGKVCVFTSATTELLVDVSGAFVVADIQQLPLTAPPEVETSISNDLIGLPTCTAGYTGTYPNCVVVVPPPTCSGITVYKDANYAGASQAIVVGKYTTSQITLGDNAVSSAKIPTGCKLTLYQGSGYAGATQVLTSDWVGFNKDPWNDKTSSLEVSLADVIASGAPKTCLIGSVVLFKDAAYGGISQTLSNSSYNASQITIGDNRLSSVKVPAGCKVTLYQNSGFSGATKVLTGDWTSVSGDPWNDITSSIEVRNLE